MSDSIRRSISRIAAILATALPALCPCRTSGAGSGARGRPKFMMAMGTGDFETVQSLMADDMVWHNEGDPSIPWIGTWRGKQAILGEFFPAYGAGASTKMWSVDHASGNDRERS